jgi:hypothetical protein
MSLVLQSTGGGSVTINEPTTASNFTVTLPAADGVTMVSGNMPAFSAYHNTTQSITTSTATKVLFNTEIFDTNNNFASSTFTPTVAGYYQINTGIRIGGTTVTRAFCAIYKNGAEANRGVDILAATSVVTASSLIYLNGSTDYIEVYAFVTATTPSFQGATEPFVYVNGSLVRAA